MNSIEMLQTIGRRHFTWPGPRKTARRRTWWAFAVYWLWSLAATVPGALAAAYLIGQAHLTHPWRQDALAVACAFLSRLPLSIIVVAVVIARVKVIATFEHVQGVQAELAEAFTSFLLALLFLLVTSPFELAAYALYWYFAHSSAAFTVAAKGGAAHSCSRRC
jgi:hypothetical protein